MKNPRKRSERGFFIKDRRGASITTGYMFSLAVSTLLLGFLINSYTGFLGSAEQNVELQSYRVISNNLALKITNFDRMLQSGFNLSAVPDILDTQVVLPRRVAGSNYLVFFTQTEVAVNHSLGRTNTEARAPLDVLNNITPRNFSSEQERFTLYYNNTTGRIDFR
ncbi:MAG: hypothetical protein HY558_02195 [Euryarchaeota archaeon]|nr:hypothetical protein [Euryarchaeota archaeon]